MKKLTFRFDCRPLRARLAAYPDPSQGLGEALAEAVLDHISTDTVITVGGVDMHLAAWLDPEHWAEDWDEKGIDPDAVSELLYAALEEE